MNNSKARPRSIAVLRWLARFWAVLDLLLAIAIFGFFNRAPFASLPITDLLLGGFYWISILALVLALAWELPGSLVAIAALIARLIAFRAIRGYWSIQLPFVVGLLAPALLFLFCWAWSRNHLSRGAAAA